MNSRTIAIVALLVISATGLAGRCFAQPGIPRETIPRDASADVRKGIEGLYSEDGRERANAAAKLGEIGEKAAPAVPFLIGLLNGEDFRLGMTISPGQAAMLALIKIGNPAVLPLVSVMANRDADPLARPLSADILGSIKDPRSVPPLIGALNDENRRLRMSAITALKQIKDPRAVEPLIGLLGDNDSDIRDAAAYSLKSITGQDLGREAAKWRSWWKENKWTAPVPR